jgi:hypothetical protein
MALIALLALASHRLSDIFLQADLFRVDSDAPGTRRSSIGARRLLAESSATAKLD